MGRRGPPSSAGAELLVWATRPLSASDSQARPRQDSRTHGLASRFRRLSRSPAPIQSTRTPGLQTVPRLCHIQPVTLTRPGGAAGPHQHLAFSSCGRSWGGGWGGASLCFANEGGKLQPGSREPAEDVSVRWLTFCCPRGAVRGAVNDGAGEASSGQGWSPLGGERWPEASDDGNVWEGWSGSGRGRGRLGTRARGTSGLGTLCGGLS